MSLVLKTPSQIFSKELVRIKYIQDIQHDLTTCGANKLTLKIQFLNQAYVFQLIAFWQVFIEELVEFGFRMIENSEHCGAFRDIARAKLEESLKKFNTPNKDNIDKLFEQALAVPKISQYWCSEALPEGRGAESLGELLKVRHQIAHEGRSMKGLSYEKNFEEMKVLMQLAELTEAALIKQLTLRSSGQSWAG